LNEQASLINPLTRWVLESQDSIASDQAEILRLTSINTKKDIALLKALNAVEEKSDELQQLRDYEKSSEANKISSQAEIDQLKEEIQQLREYQKYSEADECKHEKRITQVQNDAEHWESLYEKYVYEEETCSAEFVDFVEADGKQGEARIAK
jgi:tRNA U34 5-carboxymethylaminomethyl modifying GTPase MnmE/TrmE